MTKLRVLSPPVVQNPTGTGFSVSWMISGRAMGWVEWGTTPDLGNRVVSAHHGLATACDDVISVRVEGAPATGPLYYRVVTKPLVFENAETVVPGEPIYGEIRQLVLPSATADTCHLAIVNDTHGREATIEQLAQRISEENPDALVWNGDICDGIDDRQSMARLALTPGREKSDATAGGWASTRPLFYSPGNHDARGLEARALPEALTLWPLEAGDPPGLASSPHASGRYCFVQRIGPVALVCLDTGEDKADFRNVGGTSVFEPYRAAQREWLIQALQRPEFASAPYRIAVCHIPLHGLPGHNDGTGAEGFAFYSGFGRKLWLQPLLDAGCQMVVSGHMHAHRIDPPGADFPIPQVIGGGPDEKTATFIQIKADAHTLELTMENLQRIVVGALTLKAGRLLHSISIQ